MSDEHGIIAKLATIEQKVDHIIEGVSELKTDMKANRDKINELDKKVDRHESYFAVIKWVMAIIVTVFLIAGAYALVQAFVDYVSAYGIP